MKCDHFCIILNKTIICSDNKDQFEEPVILIDLYSLCGQFLNSDALMGGRHHLVLKNYETFFQKLTDSGAKLIFFNSGCIENVTIDHSFIVL